MKKIIALLLVVAMTAAASVAGTIAYLQDSDSDVNVMTVGNVYIEQIEQERDENGNLVSFTQGKPALPVVGPIEWATTGNGVVVNGTEYKVFTPDLKNVVDKIVTVKNTGRSDAYVRTIVAIEAPEGDPNDFIHVNVNGDKKDVTNTNWAKVELDGVEYVYSVFTYVDALKAKETSVPSMMQVFLDSKADNTYCEAFGDTWEILVLSQAVQTAGFDKADDAFVAAFGAADATNVAKWFGGMAKAVSVSTPAELKAAVEEGGLVVLTEDLAVDADTTITVPAGKETILNLAGHTIAAESDATGSNRNMFDVRGELTVTGGTLTYKHTGTNMGWNNSTNLFNVTAGGVLNLENVVAENLGGSDMAFVVHLNNWGEVTLNVNNSTLKSTYIPVRVFNSGNDMNNVTIKNSKIHGDNRAFWVHNYTAADFGGSTAKAEAHAKLLNFDIFGNNNEYTKTSTKPGPICYGFTDDIYFDGNGNVIP